jgi:hypothetical protein
MPRVTAITGIVAPVTNKIEILALIERLFHFLPKSSHPEPDFFLLLEN